MGGEVKERTSWNDIRGDTDAMANCGLEGMTGEKRKRSGLVGSNDCKLVSCSVGDRTVGDVIVSVRRQSWEVSVVICTCPLLGHCWAA